MRYEPTQCLSSDLETLGAILDSISSKHDSSNRDDRLSNKYIVVYIVTVVVGSVGSGLAAYIACFQFGFHLGEQLVILREMGK